MASKILNYKTFFKNKIILIASVVTILEAFVSYSINILMGNTRAIQSLLKPLCFSKAFTNVLSYIFSFDYFIVMYGAAMFLFFFLSKKDKKLNTAAFLLFLSGLLRLIYSSIQLIMVLFFGLYTTSPESEAYYQLAGISATFLFAEHPQIINSYLIDCAYSTKNSASTSTPSSHQTGLFPSTPIRYQTREMSF